MEIEIIIRKMKEIYASLMEFIDSTENTEIESLIKIFENQEILKSKEEMMSMLNLLLIIADNHHRLPNFIDKLEKIFQYLMKGIRTYISDLKIYKIFRNNKRIILLFLELGLIQPDEYVLSDIMVRMDYNKFPYRHYLYSGIQLFIDEKEIKALENEIKEKYDEELNNFVEKCRIGENGSYLCSLIRKDSVEEFISYVNRTNIPLSSSILPSIFETNSFLINNETTLIEYATFFGAYQIVQYLRYNQVDLTHSLWFYAIHSNNAELIHFLEENEVDQVEKQENEKYGKIFEESIKCHHNNIADYIKDNLLDQSQNDDFESCIIKSYNYFYFPTDIGSLISKPKNKYGFNISRLYCLLKQITIPSSVRSIGDNAFSDCFSLSRVIIPSSVNSIGDYAFYECSSLTEISIPSSVTSISQNSFAKCFLLKQITIPSSITSIGDSSFSECSSLAQIMIPSSVTLIGNSAFNNCTSLTQISFEIPSFVTLIGEYAFSGCSSLTQISIPSSVKCIGDFAFFGCSSLKHIAFPSSITSIGESVLSECSSLIQISIPSSVTSINENAFRGCSSLMQISIPSSVTKIGTNAFFGCTSLTDITLPSSINASELNIPKNVQVKSGNNCQIY